MSVEIELTVRRFQRHCEAFLPDFSAPKSLYEHTKQPSIGNTFPVHGHFLDDLAGITNG